MAAENPREALAREGAGFVGLIKKPVLLTADVMLRSSLS
jgi:hypothetical protein